MCWLTKNNNTKKISALFVFYGLCKFHNRHDAACTAISRTRACVPNKAFGNRRDMETWNVCHAMPPTHRRQHTNVYLSWMLLEWDPQYQFSPNPGTMPVPRHDVIVCHFICNSVLGRRRRRSHAPTVCLLSYDLLFLLFTSSSRLDGDTPVPSF